MLCCFSAIFLALKSFKKGASRPLQRTVLSYCAKNCMLHGAKTLLFGSK
jgi:hypothetical protein